MKAHVGPFFLLAPLLALARNVPLNSEDTVPSVISRDGVNNREQAGPVWTSEIKRRATLTRVYRSKTKVDAPSRSERLDGAAESDLDQELAELDSLLDQMSELRQVIQIKEARLAERYGYSSQKDSASECYGLKGLLGSVYDAVMGKISGKAGNNSSSTPSCQCELLPGDAPPPPPPAPPPPPPGRNQNQNHGIRPPPPPPRPHGLSHIFKVVILPIVLLVVLAACFKRCALWRKSRRDRRRAARAARREACRAACRSFFGRFSFARRRCRRGRAGEEAEKATMLARGHGNDNSGNDGGDYDPDCRLETTTMEEELASCKVAADMVGDIVMAEEGRSRRAINDRNVRRPGHMLVESQDILSAGAAANCMPEPLNSDNAFGVYVSAGDVPPAYDDDFAEGSSIVADGFRDPDASSRYTPASPRSQNSWEEVGKTTT